MDRPKSEFLHEVLRNPDKRKKILLTFKNQDGDTLKDNDFIEAITLLWIICELKFLTELTEVVKFFEKHWDHFSPETQQAFSLSN